MSIIRNGYLTAAIIGWFWAFTIAIIVAVLSLCANPSRSASAKPASATDRPVDESNRTTDRTKTTTKAPHDQNHETHRIGFCLALPRGRSIRLLSHGCSASYATIQFGLAHEPSWRIQHGRPPDVCWKGKHDRIGVHDNDATGGAPLPYALLSIVSLFLSFFVCLFAVQLCSVHLRSVQSRPTHRCFVFIVPFR